MSPIERSRAGKTQAASTRREFLEMMGGGLIILLMPASVEGADQHSEQPLELWLKIYPTGEVLAFTGKVEYGQGTRTGFTQVIAEELSLPMEQIRVIMGDTDLVPFDDGTFASLSTEMMRPRFQRAAARAGELLRQRAATRWHLAFAQTSLRAGQVCGPGGRSIPIGDLVKDDDLVDVLEYEPSSKAPENYEVVGKSIARVDGLEKVTGAARYGTDIRVPGMLHGAVLRPPFWGARLVTVDSTEAEKVPGLVKVVREGEFVGVAAETERAARQAVMRLNAQWEGDANNHLSTIRSQLKDAARQADIVEASGDEEKAWADSQIRRQAAYETSFVYHATLEPQAALADVKPGEVRICASTQRPFGVREQIASLLNLPAEKVHVTVSEIGGGFGRKNDADAPREAVLLSKHVGRPVRVVWSRQEDFALSTYRPATYLAVEAGITNAGRLLAWDFVQTSSGGPFSSTRDIVSFYASDFQRTRFAVVASGVRVGSFRGLGSPINAFARESFMDELAFAAGIDPLTFRLNALGARLPRLSAVLRAVVSHAGWTPGIGPGKTGRGFGLACCLYREKTYVAQLAEVHVGDSGDSVRVDRITTAVDCGFVVNPDLVKRQAEGGVTMATSYALGEALSIDGSTVGNADFNRYPVLRISGAPQVETVLVGSSQNPSMGVGEPVTVPVAAAIANACFDATGVRRRSLPLFPPTGRPAGTPPG